MVTMGVVSCLRRPTSETGQSSNRLKLSFNLRMMDEEHVIADK